MITQAILSWLVTYVSFFALFGFVLYIARSFSGRAWANSAILRSASLLAFVGATVLWVLVIVD